MGHVRLGPLPKTQKWVEVVQLLRAGAGVAQMATATLRAAAAGLTTAGKDPFVVHAAWLFLRLPLVARADRFADGLRACELDVPDEPTLCEVVAAVSDAVDRAAPNNVGRTDLGELAQSALCETLTAQLGPHLSRLFGTQPEDVQTAFARRSTVTAFGALAHAYFARLLDKYLHYHLGRAVALHVGEEQRFRTLADLEVFRRQMTRHCHERTLIVERFAGEWLSKECWEAGGVIRWEAARDFVHGALAKLAEELTEGGD